MPFNRPPRIQRFVKKVKVKIPSPENLPSKPTINWLTVGLPIVGIGLAIGLMIWLSGTTSGMSYIIFLPFILASVVASVFTYTSQRKQYEATVEEVREIYSEELKKTRSELSGISKEHAEALHYNNPNLVACLEFAKEKNYRLGERRPEDLDFLTFRLGLGSLSSEIEFDGPNLVDRKSELVRMVSVGEDLRKQFSDLRDVPILANLKEARSIGISGKRSEGLQLAQSAVVHLSTHHWPSECNFLVYCNPVFKTDWQFIESLPHKSTLLASPVNELKADALLTLEKELLGREALGRKVSNSQEKDKANILPALVVIFDNVTNAYDHPAIAQALKKGSDMGIYGIFLAEHFEDIPGECGGAISIAGERLKYETTGAGVSSFEEVTPDAIKTIDKTQFASSLEKIDWQTISDASAPPKSLSLFSLFGFKKAADVPLDKWWDGRYEKPYDYLGHLKAPIGKFSSTANLVLDLNDRDDAHGPHGFIGGATGSGKSELLKTIILSLAMTHHPYDLNFALIDFKGGAAFEELDNLPHVVGLITDIENNESYATRVIQSLTGEINSRKRILSQAKSSGVLDRPSIEEYEQLDAKIPLPRLVIIFDEFAEFKDRHPEESKKLISIARVGRSLGVHLILCTQNPAAAVDNQVRQNSRFRISLNVNSPDDSREIIGIPDAYRLPSGRGYFRINQPQLFQTAFSGKKYLEGEKEVTELQTIVDNIIEFTKRLKISQPPSVWQKPLSNRLSLSQLYEETGMQPNWDGENWSDNNDNPSRSVIGYFDDPANQRQPQLEFGGKSRSGHILFVGSPGSGKSTALMTVALDLAYRYSPDHAHIYAIDFGIRSSLKTLENLPHVAKDGGIVSGYDTERIMRLFSILRTEISSRNLLVVGGDIDDFNLTAPKSKRISSIYLLIDNLNKQIEDALPGFTNQLLEIISSGRGLGIHVGLSAGRQADIPLPVFDLVETRISLRQADDGLYSPIVGRVPKHLISTPVGEAKSAGWGLLNVNPVLEVQIALPVAGVNDDEVQKNLAATITKMQDNWTKKRATDVRVLPRHIYSKDLVDNFLINEKNGTARSQLVLPVGIGQEDLKEVTISLVADGPAFLIGSTVSNKGKTTFIQSWLLELARINHERLVEFIIIDFHSRKYGQFRDLPHVRDFVGSEEDFEKTLVTLSSEIDRRQKKIDAAYMEAPEKFDEYDIAEEDGILLIVIDDYAGLKKRTKKENIDNLDKLLSKGADFGLRLIAAEKLSMLGPRTGQVASHLTTSSCGILLGGSDGIDTFNGAAIPYGQKTTNLAPGRGYLVNRGTVSFFQAMAFWPVSSSAKANLKLRIDEIKKSTNKPLKPKKG